MIVAFFYVQSSYFILAFPFQFSPSYILGPWSLLVSFRSSKYVCVDLVLAYPVDST